MKRLSLALARWLVKHGADASSEAAYAYGAECTLSTLLILALLLVIGAVMGKIVFMLVFIAAWLPLRIFVGGAHASTHLVCTLVSVGIGAASVWATDFINSAPQYITIPIAAIFYVVFFIYAPSVHKNHPISEARRAKMRLVSRIYGAAECAVTAALTLFGSKMFAPAFMGYASTGILFVIGIFVNRAQTQKSR